MRGVRRQGGKDAFGEKRVLDLQRKENRQGLLQNFEMEYYCKVERADIYRDRIIFTFREGDKRIWQRK